MGYKEIIKEIRESSAITKMILAGEGLLLAAGISILSGNYTSNQNSAERSAEKSDMAGLIRKLHEHEDKVRGYPACGLYVWGKRGTEEIKREGNPEGYSFNEQMWQLYFGHSIKMPLDSRDVITQEVADSLSDVEAKLITDSPFRGIDVVEVDDNPPYGEPSSGDRLNARFVQNGKRYQLKQMIVTDANGRLLVQTDRSDRASTTPDVQDRFYATLNTVINQEILRNPNVEPVPKSQPIPTIGILQMDVTDDSTRLVKVSITAIKDTTR